MQRGALGRGQIPARLITSHLRSPGRLLNLFLINDAQGGGRTRRLIFQGPRERAAAKLESRAGDYVVTRPPRLDGNRAGAQWRNGY